MPSIIEAAEYFGQLVSIAVVELSPGITPLVTQPKMLILAIIGIRNTTLEIYLRIPYYTEPKTVTVSTVDINTLMCLVGCIC